MYLVMELTAAVKHYSGYQNLWVAIQYSSTSSSHDIWTVFFSILGKPGKLQCKNILNLYYLLNYFKWLFIDFLMVLHNVLVVSKYQDFFHLTIKGFCHTKSVSKAIWTLIFFPGKRVLGPSDFLNMLSLELLKNLVIF